MRYYARHEIKARGLALSATQIGGIRRRTATPVGNSLDQGWCCGVSTWFVTLSVTVLKLLISDRPYHIIPLCKEIRLGNGGSTLRCINLISNGCAHKMFLCGGFHHYYCHAHPTALASQFFGRSCRAMQVVSSVVEASTIMPPVQNRKGVYRYTCLAIWIIVSLGMVLDRFYWNMWPRQTICSPGCGTDVYCDMDEV